VGVEVNCAKCLNRGWFQDGNRRFRCVLCNRVPSKRIRLGVFLDPELMSQREDPNKNRRQKNGPGVGERSEPCQVRGCKNTTSFHKPYCLDHIFELPYATYVRETVDAVQREMELASTPRGRKQLSAYGVKATDIACYIVRHGAKTPRRLALECDFVRPGHAANENHDGYARLWAFLQVMRERRLIKVIELPSDRGGLRTVVDVTKKGRAHAERHLAGL